jgi:hypothetical protein
MVSLYFHELLVKRTWRKRLAKNKHRGLFFIVFTQTIRHDDLVNQTTLL